MTAEPTTAGSSPADARADAGADLDELTPLGAAATLPVERRARESRKERRARRRQADHDRAERPSSVPAGLDDDVEYVFEPASSTRPKLRPYLTAVWNRRRFVAEMARAEIRGPRSSTALGQVWAILDPLFQAAVYYFLFSVIRGGQGRPIEFLPALVAGIFLLALTLTALGDGGRSVRKSKNLMLNSAFPAAILPLTSVYRSVLAFVPSVFVFVGFYAVVDGTMRPAMLLLPLLFVVQMVMNVGISLLVSTLVVYVADAANLVNYVSRILFFATPVIYPVSLLPERVYDLLSFQPLFPLFATYQAIITGGDISIELVLRAVAWAVFLLVVGARVFLKYERGFALRL